MKYIFSISSHYKLLRIAAGLISFFAQIEGAAAIVDADSLPTKASSTTSNGSTFHDKIGKIELTPAGIGEFMASEGSVYFFNHLNDLDRSGKTLLDHLYENKNQELIDFFRCFSPTMRAYRSIDLDLIQAVLLNQRGAIQSLLAKKANPEVINRRGEGILHLIALEGHTDLVPYFRGLFASELCQQKKGCALSTSYRLDIHALTLNNETALDLAFKKWGDKHSIIPLLQEWSNLATKEKEKEKGRYKHTMHIDKDENIQKAFVRRKREILYAQGEIKPQILKAPTAPIDQIKFSPGGEYLACACKDQKVYIWDLSNNLEMMKISCSSPIQSFALSDKNKELIIATTNEILIYSLDYEEDTSIKKRGKKRKKRVRSKKKHTFTKKIKKQSTLRKYPGLLPRREGLIVDLTYLNERQVALAMQKGNIYILDLSTNKLSVPIDYKAIEQIIYTEKKNKIATIDRDQVIKITNFGDDSPPLIFQYPYLVANIYFSCKGDLYISYIRHSKIEFIYLAEADCKRLAQDYIASRSAAFSSMSFPDFNNAKAIGLQAKGLDKNAIYISSTEQQAIVTLKEGHIMLYENVAQDESFTFEDHTSLITTLHFSQDGQLLLSGSESGVLLIHDLQTRKTIHQFNYKQSICCGNFSQDGKQIVFVTSDQMIRICKLTSSSTILYKEKVVDLRKKEKIYDIAFAPSGNQLATIHCDQQIWVYDIVRDEMQYIGLTDSQPQHLIYSTDGSRLIVITNQQKVFRYHIKPPRKGKESLLSSPISSLQRSENGRLFAAGYDGVQVRTFMICEGDDQISHPTKCGSSPFNESQARKLKKSGRTAHDLYMHSEIDRKVAIVEVENMKTIILTDSKKRRKRKFKGHTGFITQLRFSSKGTYLLSISLDKTLRIWDLATEKEVAKIMHPLPILCGDFSSTDKQIVTLTIDGILMLWDLETLINQKKEKKRKRPLPIQQISLPNSKDVRFTNLVFSPDDQKIALSAQDGILRIWDRALNVIAIHPIDSHSLIDLAYSCSDVNKIALLTEEQKVWIYNISEKTTFLDKTTQPISHILYNTQENQFYATVNDGAFIFLFRVEEKEETLRLAMLEPDTPSLSHTLKSSYNMEEEDEKTVEIGDCKVETKWTSYIQRLEKLKKEVKDLRDRVSEEKIIQVVFSTAGNIVITLSSHHKIRIWDPFEEECELASIDSQEPYSQIAISPYGDKLATLNTKKILAIWEIQLVQKGKSSVAQEIERVVIINDSTDPIDAFCFAPEGKQIATTHRGGALRLWNAQNGEKTHNINLKTGALHHIAYTVDGKHIAIAGDEGRVCICIPADESGIEIEKRGEKITSIAFTPDQLFFAMGTDKGNLYIHNLKTTEEYIYSPGKEQKGAITNIVFAPYDQRQVAMQIGDDMIYIQQWTPESISICEQFTNKIGALQYVKIATGEYALCIITIKGNIFRPWIFPTNPLDQPAVYQTLFDPSSLRTLKPHKDTIHGICFSTDSQQLTSGSRDHQLITTQITDGGEISSTCIDRHKDIIHAVRYSHNGRYLLSTSADSTTRCRIFSSDVRYPSSVVMKREEEGCAILAGRFSEDDQLIAHADTDGVLVIWDIEKKIEQSYYEVEGYIFTLCFIPKSTHIAFAGSSGIIYLWNYETEMTPIECKGHDEDVYAIDVSPTGSRMVSVGSDSTLRIWNIEGDKDTEIERELYCIKGHSSEILSVTYTLDGAYIISGGKNNEVIIWEAETGKIIQPIQATMEHVWSVAISPNGLWLAAAGSQGQINLWEKRQQDRFINEYDSDEEQEVIALDSGDEIDDLLNFLN